MEASIQGNHTNGLLLAWFRHNGLLADTATWSKFLVKVLDAVNFTIR